MLYSEFENKYLLYNLSVSSVGLTAYLERSRHLIIKTLIDTEPDQLKFWQSEKDHIRAVKST